MSLYRQNDKLKTICSKFTVTKIRFYLFNCKFFLQILNMYKNISFRYKVRLKFIHEYFMLTVKF